MEQALEAVRLRVAVNNWEAFRLTALEGVPAAEAGERLGMKIGRVYSVRSNIQQLVQAECLQLEGTRASPD